MTAALATACFLGGSAAALGPCTAPRMAAIVAMMKSAPSRAFAFLGGLFVSYFILGVAAEGLHLASVLQNSNERLLALVFLLGGAWGLRVARCCSHAPPRREHLGLPFLAGVGMGTLAVPCCAPFLIFLLGAAGGSPTSLCLATAAFACGQLLPLALLAGVGAKLRARSFSPRLGECVSVSTAVISLSIGIYYAVLSF